LSHEPYKVPPKMTIDENKLDEFLAIAVNDWSAIQISFNLVYEARP